MVATPVHPARALIAGIEPRILFGSDTPTVGVSIEDSIAAVRSWSLDPSDERAILGETAEHLLSAVTG
jgi:predicted TIM-barrel fold metal-dependent hydrolase